MPFPLLIDTSQSTCIAAGPPVPAIWPKSGDPKVNANGEQYSEVVFGLFSNRDLKRIVVLCTDVASGVSERTEADVEELSSNEWPSGKGQDYIAKKITPVTARTKTAAMPERS